MTLMLTACVSNPSQRIKEFVQNQFPTKILTNKSDIKMVQQRLKNRGFNVGDVDGILGGNTEKQIRRFQKKEGYPVDGLVTTRLLKQLEPGYMTKSTNQKPEYDDSIAGESTVVAAGVGAAVGAGIGAVAGGEDGAWIGAAAGATVGALTDVLVNWFRVDKAENEQNLNLSIDRVRQENQRLKGMIKTAKQIIQKDRAKIKSIKQQLASKSLTRQQAKEQYAQLDKNRGILEDTYKQLLVKKKQRQDYTKNTTTTHDMDNEMNKINNEIVSLKTQLDELDQLRSISVMG